MWKQPTGHVQPDGKPLKVTKKGNVVLKVMDLDVVKNITLTEVYYASGLTQNLISYGVLDVKGYTLGTRGSQRVLENKTNGNVIFDVELTKNVLVIHATAYPRSKSCKEVIMAAIDNSHIEAEKQLDDSQKGTLVEFHRRLGH